VAGTQGLAEPAPPLGGFAPFVKLNNNPVNNINLQLYYIQQ